MLRATERLKKQADFARVFQVGKKKRIGPLLFISAESSAEAARFGIVVSKKVARLAVIRNKIRRQIANQLQVLLKDHTPEPKDTVIVVTTAEPAEYMELIKQWLKRL